MSKRFPGRHPLSRSSSTLRTLLILAAIVVWLITRFQPDIPPPAETAGETTTARVQRVVDGDTLLLEGGVRVRLIGVDTPETKHPSKPVEPFGEEAAEFTRRMVEGKTVLLEFDRERVDQYGRTLAYVYIDDRMLNEELIRAGLGPAQPQYPYRNDMKRRFLKAEEEAKQRGLGLWSLVETLR